MDSQQSSATHVEIDSQAEAVAAAVGAVYDLQDQFLTLFERGEYETVLVTGCGSTYYVSLSAAHLFQRAVGVVSRAFPAGELMLFPRHTLSPIKGRALLVAVSRSGETSETVRAVEQFRAWDRGEVVTITCQPGNTMSGQGDVNVVIEAGSEASTVQTRAFSAMWTAVYTLAEMLNPAATQQSKQLAPAVQRILTTYGERARALGSDLSLDRVYFLGSWLRYGLACEGSLKMKEMTLTHSEPFNGLEFRHGPISMVAPSTLVVALMGDDAGGHERALLQDIRQFGGRLLVLSEQPVPGFEAETMVFDAGLDEMARGVLYLSPMQNLALGRAVAKGLNPDLPRHLAPVVYL